METFLLNLLNSFAFSMLLFLLAAGLSILMGLMGILNMAHGAIYMIGSFVGWTVLVQYGLNYGLALLAAAACAAVLGLILERGFLSRLYRRPNDQVLLSLGFVYVFNNLAIWIWDPRPRIPFTPGFLDRSIQLGSLTYPLSRFVIIGAGVILGLGLWWLQEKTRAGAIIRAGMDDKEMTRGLGVNLGLVSTLVFVLAASIAGLAGVIGAPLYGANASVSFDVLLLALVVVIVGGVGSIPGTFIGSILIGLIDNFGKAYAPEFALFTIYFAMVLILLLKPSGLLGRKL